MIPHIAKCPRCKSGELLCLINYEELVEEIYENDVLHHFNDMYEIQFQHRLTCDQCSYEEFQEGYLPTHETVKEFTIAGRYSVQTFFGKSRSGDPYTDCTMIYDLQQHNNHVAELDFTIRPDTTLEQLKVYLTFK